MSLETRRGRRRDADKGLAILDAAWGLFLARGVEATSIEAIAAAAGVSKVTLYRAWPDKTALFEAAVLREMERIEAAQRSGGGAPEAVPLRARLRAFGLGIMGYLTTPPAVDFYAVVAGELRRHPALARAFYDLGPGRTRANLADLIAEAAARGELTAPDPLGAADALFGLWQGFTNFQLSLDVDTDSIRTGLEERVTRGIDLFLRYYASGEAASSHVAGGGRAHY